MARLKTADAAGVTYQGAAKDESFFAAQTTNTNKADRQQAQALANEAATKRRELERASARENKQLQVQQQLSRDQLKKDQSYALSDQKRKNDLRTGKLKQDQDFASGKLRGEQTVDRLNIELEQGYQSRFGNLKLSAVRLNSQIDQANTATTNSIVKGISALSSSFLEWDTTRKELAEKQKVYDDQTDLLQGNAGAIVSLGSAAEQAQLQSEVAATNAVMGATNDPIDQDTLLTEQSEGRVVNNNNQIGTLRFGSMLTGILSDGMDTDMLIRFPNGRVGKPSSAKDSQEVEWALSAILGNAINANGGVDNLNAAQLGTLTNQANQALSTVRSQWVAKVVDRKQQAVIDSSYGLFKESAFGGGDIGIALRNMADQYWSSGRYTSRTAATEAAIKDATAFGQNMNNGMGNTDLLRAINGTPMRVDESGNPISGSEAWTYAGNSINDAINESDRDRETLRDAQSKQILQGMYQELAKVKDDSGKKLSVINKTIAQLEGAGLYEQAKKLESQQEAVVFEEMAEQVINGEITSPDKIDQAYQLDTISLDQRASLLNTLKAENATRNPSDPDVAKQTAAFADSTIDPMFIAVGLQRDSTGRVIQLESGKNNPAMNAADAPIIENQIKAEINRVANQVMLANPDLKGADLQREVHKALLDWRRDNVDRVGGSYYYGDAGVVLDDDAAKYEAHRASIASRFSNLVNDADALTRIDWSGQSDGVTGKDFSHLTGPNGLVYPNVIEDFNPLRGDKLFERTDLNNIAKEYRMAGTFSAALVTAATSVGMSPLGLLNQQMGAYGWTDTFDPETIQADVAYSAQNVSAPMTSVQGAQKLMQMNFPAKGAAWLAGNIQQESGWNGMRPSWDDVGAPAGGLVSWRAGRLQRLERAFGRPVSDITNEEQLTYMVQELQKPAYAAAYQIFMNPHATDRQLIKASKIFWGYGIEGNRYGYARDIEQQL